MKNGKDVPSVKRERQHNWWRYLLTFLGGFFACIGVIVGGLAITGTAVKLGDLVAMTGNNPAEILGENYRNDTLLTFIQKMSSKKFETLGDINEISPKIESIVKDTINPVLKENIKFEFDWDELKIKPFEKNESSTRPATEYDKTESISEYIPRVFKSTITLASFVDPDGTATGVLKYFLYPYAGGVFDTNNPYSIGTFADSGPDFFNNIINNIKVGDIIDTSGNAFLSQMAEWGLSEFTDEKIKTLKIGPLFSDEEKAANPLLNAIATKDWSISDLSNMDNINGLKIGDIIDTSGMSSGLIYAIRNNTIEDLQSDGFINTLALKDIFPSATGIMGTLISHNFTVGMLSNDEEIKALTLEEILGTIPSTSVLFTFKDTQLKDVNDIDVSSVRLDSVLSVEQIHDNPILNAIYEPDNHDVKISALSNPDTINNLPLSKVFPSATGVLKVLGDKGFKIGDLSNGDTIMTLTLEDVLGTIDSSSALYHFRTKRLNELSSIDISGLRLDEVLDYETKIKTNNILNALWNKSSGEVTVGDLSDSDTITGLLLADVFPDTTGVMSVLAGKGYTINQLMTGDVVSSLTLQEVVGTIDENSVLYNFRNTPISDIDDIDVSDVKLTSVMDLELQIKPNKILNALWESNHNITIGQLSEPSTIMGLGIEDVIDCAGSKILQALAAKGATIGNLSEKVELLTLADAVDIGDDPNAIIYKVANSPALAGRPISEIGAHFDELRIGDILNVTSTSPQLVKTLENVQLKDLGTRMNTLTASDVILIGGPEDPLYAIKDTPVSDSAALMEAIKDNLRLKDVAEIDESSPEVLKSLQNTTLTDIPTVLTTLTLSEIITIESTSPQILKSLANVHVFGDGDDNLQYYLTHLKFNDYFTSSDCSSGILKVLWDSTNPAGDFEISEIASKINDLKIIDVLEDEIYCDPVVIQDGHKKIKPAWWYLLTEEGETFTSSEEYFVLGNGKDYTINDMNKLVTNMEYHMKNESLFNLIRAEFVTVSSAAMTKLETPIPLDPEGRRYGDLTISEFLNAAALFL